MSSSRAVREAFAAKTAELKFKEYSGSLVSKKEVAFEANKLGRMIRDKFTALPDRLAALLAATSNQFEVHRILEDAIRRELESCKELGGANNGMGEHEAAGV